MRPLRLIAAVTTSPRLLGARPYALAAPGRIAPDSLSGAGGTAPAPDRPPTRARLRAWAELLRVSALFTVPGDALAGAAAAGRRPGRGTALAVGASLCLYEAGMALNDWADREEDAVDRPHRPIPSGRVAPGAALAAAGALTAGGLALAARAGRPALAVASGLAATVWAYDLRLKHTKFGPAAMASARALDLMLGATASKEPAVSAGGSTARRIGPAPAPGPALPPAPAPAPGPAPGPAPVGGRPPPTPPPPYSPQPSRSARTPTPLSLIHIYRAGVAGIGAASCVADRCLGNHPAPPPPSNTSCSPPSPPPTSAPPRSPFSTPASTRPRPLPNARSAAGSGR